MNVFRLVYLIPVLTAVFYCSHCHAQDKADYRNFPCPNPEDIEPCTCTYEEDLGVMDMNCTYIADEEQLYDVFHSDIPVPEFRELVLGTNHLTTLSDTVFGDSTFEVVFTTFLGTSAGVLRSVGPNTLIKSASRLRVLALHFNQISDFPFDTLSQYKQLLVFSMFYNPLSSFPVIYSESLMIIDMGELQYHEIPADALDGLPNLVEINLTYNPIESLAKEVFTSVPKLQYIYMSMTRLKHLESLQFAVNSTDMVLIELGDCHIETVEPDTFRGVQSGEIFLGYNMLTILPEATWKPLMDAGVHILLQGNYLTCGCDVAWLVLEPTYHPLVETAKCHSGEMLVDLDPHWFENNC